MPKPRLAALWAKASSESSPRRLVLSSRWRAVFGPDAGRRRGGELDFGMEWLFGAMERRKPEGLRLSSSNFHYFLKISLLI
jgi:hypothetical protein